MFADSKESVPESMEEIDIQTVSNSLHGKKTVDIVASHPQETLMVLRKWLNENG